MKQISECVRGSYCLLGTPPDIGHAQPFWPPFAVVQIIDSEGTQAQAAVRGTIAVVDIATGHVLYLQTSMRVLPVKVKLTCFFDFDVEVM